MICLWLRFAVVYEYGAGCYLYPVVTSADVDAVSWCRLSAVSWWRLSGSRAEWQLQQWRLSRRRGHGRSRNTGQRIWKYVMVAFIMCVSSHNQLNEQTGNWRQRPLRHLSGINVSSMDLTGLTHKWKSRRIYPKYMPKCLVGSTDYVSNFYLKILGNVDQNIDVWNFRQKWFMWRHFRQWRKTSALAAYFSRNFGTANTVLLTIQTFNEHSRMAKLSQPYLRGHMRWNVTRLCFLCLRNREA